MGYLVTVLRHIRQTYHPMFHLRKLSPVASVLSRIKIPIALRFPDIGHAVYIDLLRNMNFLAGPADYENGEISTFQRIVRQNNLMSLFDVGANVGLYSFKFCSLQPQGRAVAFEPDPANVALLERTRKVSGAPLTIVTSAISDRCGEAAFFLDDFSGTTGGLDVHSTRFVEQHYVAKARQTSVNTTTLDEACDAHFVPDIVKIDVEGAELPVLQGASRLLELHKPIIIIELTNAATKQAVLQLLDDRGYELLDAADCSTIGPATLNYLAFVKQRGHSVQVAANVRCDRAGGL